MGNCNLHLGDCLAVLKNYPDNHFDSIVTDPPYGLSFMGKKWDYDVPSKEVWQECLRVLKPGGHLLAFGGTRTYHRLVVNIEDAGFEIRDQIQWLYGSGFPKSHDISKAIDKMYGTTKLESTGKTCPDIRANNFSNSEGKERLEIMKSVPQSEDAKQWQGWGSALKPANEPICVARKPLEKGLTLAQNVLKYGTGAINIDESRIGTETVGWAGAPGFKNMVDTKTTLVSGGEARPVQGRWPANIILDETAAIMLDEQSGLIRARNGYGVKGQTGGGTGSSYKMTKPTPEVSQKVIRDSENGTLAGASRFFYVAKASKRERNEGLEGMPLVKCGMMEDDNYEIKTGSGNPRDTKNQNFHPTVKPVKLMEYLVRLVTPPGGIVLDPFLGSGTTGIAALNLDFNFSGVEMNAEYIEIAQKRIKNAEKVEA